MEVSVEKIILEVKPNQPTVLVRLEKSNGIKDTFFVAQDAISSLFSGNYCSGYLPCSDDGIVYLEEKDGFKLVVVQRGLKKDRNLVWDDHSSKTREEKTHVVNTPWSFFFFILAPADGGYVIRKERIYLSDGPTRGPGTSILNGEWTGNVYGRPPKDSAQTNICWGNFHKAGASVSIASLQNIAGDFYTQDFTNHIQRSVDPWKKFTTSGDFNKNVIGTMATVIGDMWHGVIRT